MESPLCNMEQREAKPYAGESEAPLSLSLGVLTFASFALIAIATRAFDGAIGFNVEPFIGLGLTLSSSLIIWGLIRQSVTLRWGIGVPAKKQVIAQVRRGMVNGGYLPHDMALWSPRGFKCRLRPRYKVVEVSYSGSMLKPPFDLGDYLLETHATDALDIATIVEDPLPARWGGVKLVLRYSLEDEVA